MPSLTPLTLMALGYVTLAAPVVQAAVSTEEAASLKTKTTPLGAERAVKEDISIPQWEGRYLVDSSYNFASIPNLLAMRRTF